jgi:hypothetical protein
MRSDGPCEAPECLTVSQAQRLVRIGEESRRLVAEYLRWKGAGEVAGGDL